MYPSSSTSVDVSKLSFTEDGSNLVVELPFRKNNSQHLLWTSITLQPKDIYLNFEVIQNRDLYVRSEKTIEVVWRISDWKAAGQVFHVGRNFNPTTDELEALLPDLQRLAENGRRFCGMRLPKV